jgi:hypothetical protein
MSRSLQGEISVGILHRSFRQHCKPRYQQHEPEGMPLMTLYSTYKTLNAWAAPRCLVAVHINHHGPYLPHSLTSNMHFISAFTLLIIGMAAATPGCCCWETLRTVAIGGRITRGTVLPPPTKCTVSCDTADAPPPFSSNAMAANRWI